jgi:putative transposase
MRDRPGIDKMGYFGYRSAMPRTAWVARGGMVFHVLNRGVARMQLFEKPADYQAFDGVLRETLDEPPMRICACSLMPNHRHLLLWPEHESGLASFMQRLTITHVRRWQKHRGYAELGHLYGGRYKSFPVESDEHFRGVARYAGRNALRAQLVPPAEEWRWSSLWRQRHGTAEQRSLLAPWPIDRPANWVARINQADNDEELESLRESVRRGCPFGQPDWQKPIAKRLALESAYRSSGRPRKVGRSRSGSKA